MTSALPTDINRLFTLERVDGSRFRSEPIEPSRFRVFGGQVLAQGLLAAGRTVDADRKAHSLHAYFLRPGDAAEPIDYVVVDLREGRSFSTRRVEAVQGERVIFEMLVSFQPLETGLEHQWTMPADVPSPDSLRPDATMGDNGGFVDMRRDTGRSADGPIPPETATCLTWSRVYGTLPDDQNFHAALLAYCSDMTLLVAAGEPLGIDIGNPSLQSASMDHAIWFHREFRADDWLLHEVVSPSLSGSRALCTGRVFSPDGRLVATIAQEGLIRQLDRPDA